MSTFQEFKDLSQQLADRFQMHQTFIHEHIVSISSKQVPLELARLIYYQEEKVIGVAFHIEVIPTDSIQIFSAAKTFHNDVQLVPCYFETREGTIYNGIDAQIMQEREKETKYLEVLESRVKSEKEAYLKLKQLEKAGKVTFH